MSFRKRDQDATGGDESPELDGEAQQIQTAAWKAAEEARDSDAKAADKQAEKDK